jgi:hypothetical protein
MVLWFYRRCEALIMRFVIAFLFCSIIPSTAQNAGDPPSCDWLAHIKYTPDIKPLAIKVAARHLYKDQYETETDFQARASKVMAEILPGDRRVSTGRLLPESVGRYSPERQILTFSEQDLLYVLTEQDDLRGIDQYYEGMNDGEPQRELDGVKQMQNAFGNRVTVHVVEQTQYQIGFHTPPYHRIQSPDLPVSIPMPPDVARRVRPFALQILLGGEFNSGHIYTYTSHHEPDLDEPYDTTTNYKMLVVDHPCGVIRNSITHEVLAVFRL